MSKDNYSISVGPAFEVKQITEIIRLTSEGLTNEEIESKLGLPASTIRKAKVFAEIQELEGYVLNNPALERALVKAQALKDMLESDAPRDRMTAAKILISDPSLGFTQEGPVVKIEISETLKKLDPGKLPWEESSE